jgi:hypothetical protein
LAIGQTVGVAVDLCRDRRGSGAGRFSENGRIKATAALVLWRQQRIRQHEEVNPMLNKVTELQDQGDKNGSC